MKEFGQINFYYLVRRLLVKLIPQISILIILAIMLEK